jgi:uncharacterized membrane protein
MNLKFPTDRVVYFSDAVFAIAITLLVIEIKIPTHDQIAMLGSIGVLQKLIPLFIGFFVSFLVTALFWRGHLLLYHMVKDVDNKLLWINIWMLLFVALLPFSTGFYSENFGLNVPFFVYCLNLAAIGSMSFIMTSYVIRKEKLDELVGVIQTRWMKQRALVVPIIFLACIPLTYANGLVGRLGFLLIFVIQIIGNRYYKKKAAAA